MEILTWINQLDTAMCASGSATGVTKKEVNGRALHEFICLVSCAPRGAICDVAPFTEWVYCGEVNKDNVFIVLLFGFSGQLINPGLNPRL